MTTDPPTPSIPLVPQSAAGSPEPSLSAFPSWAFGKESIPCKPGTTSQRDYIFFRDLGVCVFCATDLTEIKEEMHIDHLVPVDYFKSHTQKKNCDSNDPSATGNYRENLALSCRLCNKAKGNWPLPNKEDREIKPSGEVQKLPTGWPTLSRRDYISRARLMIGEKLKTTYGDYWLRNALVRCHRVFKAHPHCHDYMPSESTCPQLPLSTGAKQNVTS